MPPFTVSTPEEGKYIDETLVVQLTAYTDNTQTTVDVDAETVWQRYVQSAPDVFDITDRSNLAGMQPDCIHVRYFDPNNQPTPLYTSPGECDNISVPIENTTAALQEAYARGDFSIMIDGCDAVDDLGFVVSALYQDNGQPIPFSEFVPGKIYVDPRFGMFLFFHFPDQWDDCSYWDFAWWDANDILITGVDTTEPPYVTDWDSAIPVHPFGVTTPGCEWDGEGPVGFATPSWDDVDTPLPLNTYWDTVSEAPTADAAVICAYWTQDSADPDFDNDPDPPVRSHLYTSPITLSTDSQLRFFSRKLPDQEVVRIATYRVGLRLELVEGLNLISQPREIDPIDSKWEDLIAGLDVEQVFRLNNGLWEVFVPNYSAILNDFEDINNSDGFFVIMNSPNTFCIDYGTAPTSTEISVVNSDTNQGINAIGVPRSSIADNSIQNLLENANIEYSKLFRVTNQAFETYIPDRADVLNFNPADLTPGRGYGFVTIQDQTFEIPFE